MMRALQERFADRQAAGDALADALAHYRGADVLVLGLPRGGIPVAARVAEELDGELDVIVARKLPSPISQELAIGAITADGERFLNEGLISELAVSDTFLSAVTQVQRAEARKREQELRGTRPPPRITGRIVILVDDGLATGATMHAAVRSVRKQGPAQSCARGSRSRSGPSGCITRTSSRRAMPRCRRYWSTPPPCGRSSRGDAR